jgi:hypothetical protein
MTIQRDLLDPHRTRAALAANPLAGDPDRADELLDAVFEANARWLPRFFPDG